MVAVSSGSEAPSSELFALVSAKAVIVSSPPWALTTRFSVVPMSIENGTRLDRSKRIRFPLGVMVKMSAAVAPPGRSRA